MRAIGLFLAVWAPRRECVNSEEAQIQNCSVEAGEHAGELYLIDLSLQMYPQLDLYVCHLLCKIAFLKVPLLDVHVCYLSGKIAVHEVRKLSLVLVQKL